MRRPGVGNVWAQWTAVGGGGSVDGEVVRLCRRGVYECVCVCEEGVARSEWVASRSGQATGSSSGGWVAAALAGLGDAQLRAPRRRGELTCRLMDYYYCITDSYIVGSVADERCRSDSVRLALLFPVSRLALGFPVSSVLLITNDSSCLQPRTANGDRPSTSSRAAASTSHLRRSPYCPLGLRGTVHQLGPHLLVCTYGRSSRRTW
jgi:hypothetical protein